MKVERWRWSEGGEVEVERWRQSEGGEVEAK